MDKNPSRGFLWEILDLSGGWYLTVALFLVQIVSFPAIALGMTVAQVNSSYTSEQLRAIFPFAITLILLSNSLKLISNYLFTRNAFQRLNKWARGENLASGIPEEINGWKEIIDLTGRFIRDELISTIVVILIPLLLYLNFGQGATGYQLIYTFFGVSVSAISTVIISVMLIGRVISPARVILLPAGFEEQLTGTISTPLSTRFQFIIISTIIVIVLIVAPLGFKMAYTILYDEVGSVQAFRQLQWMLIIGSVVAILLGAGVSKLLTNSVAQPIRYLVDVFEKAEQGDLTQRASVLTTDEIGVLAVRFNHMISRLEILQRNLESEVSVRTAQLEATSEIGRVASSTLDPDELASQIVNLITNKFGHYYASLFLIDNTNSWADLVDATGEAGKLLKERRHRLPVPGKSMVSYAILNREPRVAQNVVDESARYENPFLAETRSELALPLSVGDHVLGALDIQSKKLDAFSADDIKTFQNMANQVAVALENASLFKSTQGLLEEMRTASQQYIPLSWSDLTRAGGIMQYETKAPVLSDSNLFKTEVPLILRDQIMGHIVVEGENEWTSAQQNLLEAIAAQTSFALENARLLSESQQTALRERLASAIVERIWSSQSVEGILQTTIRELGRALETSEAIIELKVEE